MKQSPIFILFFALIFSFQLNAQTAIDYYESAGQKFDAFNFPGAITDYSAAIRLDPNYTNAYFNRGLANAELEKYDAAIMDINQVLRLTPSDWDVYAQRANIKKMMGDLNGAIADYTMVLNQKRDAAVYSDRGVAFLEMNQFEEALQDFRESIALDPNTAITWSQMADVYFAKGENSTAIQHYSAALDIEPNLVVALNNRGNAFKASKMYDEAISDYTTAIEITAISDLYANRSIAYSAKHLFNLAIEDSQYALKLDNKNPVAYYSLGAAQMEANNLDDALVNLNKTIELDQTYADAFAKRAELKYLKNDYKGAIQDQEYYLTVNNNDITAINDLEKYKYAWNDLPRNNHTVVFHSATQVPTTSNSMPSIGTPTQSQTQTQIQTTSRPPMPSINQTPNAYNSTANINELMASRGAESNSGLSAQQLYFNGALAYNNKDYWKAVSAFDDVIERDPGNYRARNLRGLCFLILKKYGLAAKDFDEVALTQPNFADAYHNRANLKIKNDRVNAAIRDYTKAIELDSTIPNYFENRGRAYLRTQEFLRAKDDFDRASILNPKNPDYDFLAGYACLKNYQYELARNYFSIMEKKNPAKAIQYKEYIDLAR